MGAWHCCESIFTLEWAQNSLHTCATVAVHVTVPLTRKTFALLLFTYCGMWREKMKGTLKWWTSQFPAKRSQLFGDRYWSPQSGSDKETVTA